MVTDNPNPYQPPPELPTEPLEVDSEVERLEFVTDWSAVGIRARRKRAWHQTFDFAFGALTIFLVGVLILACSGLFRSNSTFRMVGRLVGGATCWLVPVWVIGFVFGINLWT